MSKGKSKGRPRKPEMTAWSCWMDQKTIETIRELARVKKLRQSDLISQAIRKTYGQ